jgi:hypothetical protein
MALGSPGSNGDLGVAAAFAAGGFVPLPAQNWVNITFEEQELDPSTLWAQTALDSVCCPDRGPALALARQQPLLLLLCDLLSRRDLRHLS